MFSADAGGVDYVIAGEGVNEDRVDVFGYGDKARQRGAKVLSVLAVFIIT